MTTFIFNPLTHKFDVSLVTAVPPGTVASITGDTGGPISPSGGTVAIQGNQPGNLGAIEFTGSGAGQIYVSSVVDDSSIAISATGELVSQVGVATYVVSPTANEGNYTTIQAAVNAASSGDTIFIKDGTYNESVVLKAGLNITAAAGSGFSGNVNITGGFTFAGGGDVFVNNIRFTSDNQDSIIFNGATEGSVNLTLCYFECTNNNSVYYTNTDADSSITIEDCDGDMSGNLPSFIFSNSPGGLSIFDSIIGNSGFNFNQINLVGTVVNISDSIIMTGLNLNNCLAFLNNARIYSLGDAVNLNSGAEVNAINSLFVCQSSFTYSVFSGDDTCSFTFRDCGIGGGIQPQFDGNMNVLYDNLYEMSNGIIDTGSASVSYLTSYVGDIVASSLISGSTFITDPGNSVGSSLALGVAYQNTLNADAMLTVYLAVSSATSGSILCGVGPSTIPTQQTIVSSITLASLNIIPVSVYLPANYYAVISTSGTIAVTISGQQLTKV